MSTNSDAKSQQILKKIARFKPPRSVDIILHKGTADDLPQFLRAWELARLLAWVFLDQPKMKEQKKQHDAAAASRPVVKTRSAKQAGRIVLAHILDQHLSEVRGSSTTKKLALANDFNLVVALVRSSGGFAKLVEGRSGTSLLSNAELSRRDFGYVYRIVGYLCRCKIDPTRIRKDTIGDARSFVELNCHEGMNTYGESRIEKIWNQYKTSAPYLFAFHECLLSTIDRKAPIREVVALLTTLAADQKRLEHLFGIAAYVADILAKKAHDVRTDDFKGIKRVAPEMVRFDKEELAIIESIKRDAPIG